jgi:hypothetical protein
VIFGAIVGFWFNGASLWAWHYRVGTRHFARPVGRDDDRPIKVSGELREGRRLPPEPELNTRFKASSAAGP